MRLTLSMPSFLRPQRTKRAIECICNQTINGWEALVVGDGCPVMQDFIDSDTFGDMKRDVEKRGNSLLISNLEKNVGGHGYYITNMNIQRAKGKYILFYANDDVILPDHFYNYLSLVEADESLDFAYYDSWVEPYGGRRHTELKYGQIGHSELIIKTSFAKMMPPHSPNYGHDWRLISDMLDSGAKFKKGESNPVSYIVKSVPFALESGID